MIFNASDYARLHALVFSEGYPGYRPNVREVPNGDGRVDAEKRFAHVATKYLAADTDLSRAAALEKYLLVAHARALEIAKYMCVPERLWPALDACALRVLEYPPGVGGERHTDFDLFAVNCYRNQRGAIVGDDGLPASQEVHLGDLAEIFGLGPAFPHRVLHGLSFAQHSIVYFALPAHDATMTVGQWLAERVKRSRVAA